MAMYDKKSAEAMLTLVGIACELQINPNKTELKDKS
jgi:hypothetical protein